MFDKRADFYENLDKRAIYKNLSSKYEKVLAVSLREKLAQVLNLLFILLRLRIVSKSARLSKSIERFLPIYKKISITEKLITVSTSKLVTLFNIMLTRYWILGLGLGGKSV